VHTKKKHLHFIVTRKSIAEIEQYTIGKSPMSPRFGNGYVDNFWKRVPVIWFLSSTSAILQMIAFPILRGINPNDNKNRYWCPSAFRILPHIEYSLPLSKPVYSNAVVLQLSQQPTSKACPLSATPSPLVYQLPSASPRPFPIPLVASDSKALSYSPLTSCMGN
jgi:hypothetical protein